MLAPTCPDCGSTDIVKSPRRTNSSHHLIEHHCHGCGHDFFEDLRDLGVDDQRKPCFATSDAGVTNLGSIGRMY